MYAVMFHHFHDDGIIHIKSQGSISENDLDKIIIKYQSLKGVRIIPAKDWYNKFINNSLRKDEICLTFDDGLKCQYEIAHKVLKKHNLTAFFFTPTLRFTGKLENLDIFRHFRFFKFNDIDDFYEKFFMFLKKSTYYEKNNVSKKIKLGNAENYHSEITFYTKNDRIFRFIRDKILSEDEYNEVMYNMMSEYNYNFNDISKKIYLSENDIKDLHNNENIIGLHSHSHNTFMADLSYDEQEYEYSTNKKILEEIIDSRIKTVSYPCSSYNKDTLDIMKKMDIKLGFRANMLSNYNSELEVKRIDHTEVLKEINNENNSIHK